jgi:acyl carrier protein
MTDADIKKIVNKALIEEFELNEEELTAHAHIRNDLGLDSLDIVDMVIVLEKAFSFKLPNREVLAEIQTIGDMYAFIISLRDSGIIQK